MSPRILRRMAVIQTHEMIVTQLLSLSGMVFLMFNVFVSTSRFDERCALALTPLVLGKIGEVHTLQSASSTG